MHAPHRTTRPRAAFCLGLGPALALLALAALAGCGGKPAPAPGAPATAGSAGGATAGSAGAAATTGCAREIAIRCKSGVDGCDDGRTIEHVCVPTDAVAGPPCAQELALECPPGQRDGCLFQPAVSLNHICVYE